MRSDIRCIEVNMNNNEKKLGKFTCLIVGWFIDAIMRYKEKI